MEQVEQQETTKEELTCGCVVTEYVNGRGWVVRSNEQCDEPVQLDAEIQDTKTWWNEIRNHVIAGRAERRIRAEVEAEIDEKIREMTERWGYLAETVFAKDLDLRVEYKEKQFAGEQILNSLGYSVNWSGA